MIAPSKQDSRFAWLGGEAHVRRQEEGFQWHVPVEWQQALWMIGALVVGSALCGVAASTRLPREPNRGRERGRDEARRADIEASQRRRRSGGAGPIALALAGGAAIGVGVGLMSAPYSGVELRRRIALGVKTAQEEFSEAVEDTREAVGALKKDARQTLRQTAMRMTEVVTATKAALTSEEDSTWKEYRR